MIAIDPEEDTVPGRLKRLNYIFLRNEIEQAREYTKLIEVLDKDIGWVRDHTRYVELADRWYKAGSPEGQLLRHAIIATVAEWAERRPQKAPEIPQLLLDFLQASRAFEGMQRDKMRQIIGRAFVKPSLLAATEEHGEQALRLSVAGCLLADDIEIRLVPELWGATVVALMQNRTQLVLRGHKGAVTDVAFHPDGSHFITASDDYTARIWDAYTGKQLLSLTGHEGPVTSVAFFPDGRKVLTGSEDETSRVWDANTGEQLLRLKGSRILYDDIDFYDDSDIFMNRSVRIRAALSSDGRFIVATSDDKIARIWDAVTGEHLLSLEADKGKVLRAEFSPDEKRIVTSSDGDLVRIWNANTGEKLLGFEGENLCAAGAVFSPNGQYIVTVSSDNILRIWDTRSGVQQQKLKGHTKSVNDIVFSLDCQRIVSVSTDTTARIWDISTGKQIYCCKGHIDSVNSVIFSPDGQCIVTTSNDNTARVWDANTGAQIFQLRGHADAVNKAVFSPNGRSIVTVAGSDSETDTTVRIWDARTGEQVHSLGRHDSSLISAVFDPAGKTVLTVTRDEARLWDANTGARLHELKTEKSFTSAMFNTEGQKIITVRDHNDFFGDIGEPEARIWDTDTGMLVPVIEDNSVSMPSAKFSLDRKRTVEYFHDRAEIQDVESGNVLQTFRGHTKSLTDVAFAPNGQQIVTSSEDKTARVWDAKNGKQLSILEGHIGFVLSALFSPEGRRIVTVSSDMTARIWDAETGVMLLNLEGHGERINTAVFSPDGAYIVTASEDKTARIWDVSRTRVIYSYPRVATAAAAMADGKGLRSNAEAADLLMQDAPEDLFVAVLQQLGLDVDDYERALTKGIYPNDPKQAKIICQIIDSAKALRTPHLASVAPLSPARESESEQWYLQRNGKKYGPLTRAQLWKMQEQGQFQFGDKLWRKGLDGWVPLDKIKWNRNS